VPAGYFRVSTRPPTADEQAAEVQRLREVELTRLKERLAALDRPVSPACGRAACCLLPLALASTFLLLTSGLWRRPEVVLAVLSVCLLAAVLDGTLWRRDERRRLGQQIAATESMAEPGEPLEELITIEARIAGAVFVWTYHAECLDQVVLDLGDGRLLIIAANEDAFWEAWAWRLQPGRDTLRREFRLTVRRPAGTTLRQLVGYEPLADEEVECRMVAWYNDLDPLRSDGLAEALRWLAAPYDNYSPEAEIPGRLETWIDDVLRAYRPAGPRSLSRAEREEDSDRGLSRPE